MKAIVSFPWTPDFKPAFDLNALIEVEFLTSVSGSFYVDHDGFKFGECPGSVYSDTPVGIRSMDGPLASGVT